MNHAQNLVINSDSDYITVTAGPGSGKTTTAIGRISRLIRDGCPASQIVAITFTNVAAREIEIRLAKAVGATVSLGYAGTLHGFLLRLIQTHAKVIGYQSGIVVIDEADKESLITSLIKSHRWNGSKTAIEKQIAAGPVNAGKRKEEILALDYYASLRRGNSMDFDAILYYGLQLVKRTGPLPYQHLFVDEYQDSGELDVKIYHALQIPNRIFIGDSDQSIFGFRGARPDIMVAQMESAKGYKVVLETNYRCGKNICEVANRLIRNNTNRFDKKTVSGVDYDGAVYIREFDSAVAEMNYIASEIDRSGKPPESFAVLTRSNAQARELASFLEAVGIKVARKSAKCYPNGWHQMLALLKFLSSPDNDDLAADWLQCISGEPAAKSARRKAAESFSSINQIMFKIVPPLTLAAAQSYIRDSNLSPDSLAYAFRASQRLHCPESASVSELLHVLNTEDLSDEAEQAGVTVCTIHKAKGREWDSVYMPGMEQGMLPLTSDRADLEEERRLAFVGVTRAKETLVISHCKRRAKEWLGEVQQIPSQFIQEMMLRPESA
jgi:DNA helicase-2/ATP-dependent DNA helicase PcrA